MVKQTMFRTGLMLCAFVAVSPVIAQQESPAAEKTATTSAKPAEKVIKIRYIDTVDVMKTSKAGVQARKKLEAQEQAFTQELKEKGEELQQAMIEYNEKAPVMSEEEQAKQGAAIQKDRAEYEERVNQISYQMNAAVQKVTEELGKQLEGVAADLAKREKIDAIHDIATGRVVYAADSLKITKDIVKDLDTQYDQKQAKLKKAADAKKADAKA